MELISEDKQQCRDVQNVNSWQKDLYFAWSKIMAALTTSLLPGFMVKYLSSRSILNGILNPNPKIWYPASSTKTKTLSSWLPKFLISTS